MGIGYIATTAGAFSFLDHSGAFSFFLPIVPMVAPSSRPLNFLSKDHDGVQCRSHILIDLDEIFKMIFQPDHCGPSTHPRIHSERFEHQMLLV